MTKTKYPIICAPMNGVSDLNLALACYNAGIMPSLLLVNSDPKSTEIDVVSFEADLKKYVEATDFGPLMVACDVKTLMDNSVFDMFVEHKVSYVEILDTNRKNLQDIFYLSSKAKSKNIIVSPKLLGGHSLVSGLIETYGLLECITLKGPMGAGRGLPAVNLEEEVVKIKTDFPTLEVIGSGGINTCEDVKKMIDIGCSYVSLGTIFSASVESKLSDEAKKKLVDYTFEHVTRLSKGAAQNALVFSSTEEDDANNTAGLLKGITTGTEGHIYAGTGIDYISSVEPVQSIVERLTSCLAV